MQGGLVKKERAQIFKLFLNANKLKFNEIEKGIQVRSNMVSYHIDCMQKEDLLEKRGQYYVLTKTAERYLPLFTHVMSGELSPLPTVLVAVTNKDKLLLIKRTRRPYKNYWSLIGGKMRLEERFEDASLRQVRSKAALEGKYTSMNAVLHEQVEGEGLIKHSFILFFTKVITNETAVKSTDYGELKWFNTKDIEKEKIRRNNT